MRLSFDDKSKCSLCESTATAKWIGHDTIFICRKCAQHIIPRLIADALLIPGEPSIAVINKFKLLEIPYLEAALNISNAKK